jgi:hypothetical protein
VDVVTPNEGDEATGANGHQTFCAYTNADYNSGRGVSFVVTPEVAASVTMETFGMSIGGMEGVVGEEMGMWEVKYAGEKGKGLFAKKDIAGIFPGESLIVQTPVLFVARQLPETEERPQHVLKQAVEQLPTKTREMVKKLDVNVDGTVEDIVLTNGIRVKWPWVDEVPELLAVIPEAAVSLTVQSPIRLSSNFNTAYQPRMPAKHLMALRRLHTLIRSLCAQRYQAR